MNCWIFQINLIKWFLDDIYLDNTISKSICKSFDRLINNVNGWLIWLQKFVKICKQAFCNLLNLALPAYSLKKYDFIPVYFSCVCWMRHSRESHLVEECLSIVLFCTVFAQKYRVIIQTGLWDPCELYHLGSYHNTGNSVSYPLRQVVGFYYIPQML